MIKTDSNDFLRLKDYSDLMVKRNLSYLPKNISEGMDFSLEACMNCDKCKNMCRIPCLGTPEDISNLINAGYGNRLKESFWAFGIIAETHEDVIKMIQPEIKDGWCTFYKNGLCELHNLGLKPLEGKLANCKTKPVSTKEDLLKPPLYKIVELWEKLDL